MAPHRDPEFLRKERYIRDHINECDTASGIDGLTEPLRSYVITVCQQYQAIGYVSRYDLADGHLLAVQVRHSATQTWEAVKPLVRGERQIRGGEFTFLNSFEAFVRKARALDMAAEERVSPPSSRKGIGNTNLKR